jgi:Flp pilus assembly CpaF family ATPase
MEVQSHQAEAIRAHIRFLQAEVDRYTKRLAAGGVSIGGDSKTLAELLGQVAACERVLRLAD